MKSDEAPRTPIEILADWISGFVGDDKPVEAWEPDAQIIVEWLADEGYQITRTD